MVKFGLSAYSVLFLALFLQFPEQAKEGYSKVDISDLILLVEVLEKVSEAGEQLRKDKK